MHYFWSILSWILIHFTRFLIHFTIFCIHWILFCIHFTLINDPFYLNFQSLFWISVKSAFYIHPIFLYYFGVFLLEFESKERKPKQKCRYLLDPWYWEKKCCFTSSVIWNWFGCYVGESWLRSETLLRVRKSARKRIDAKIGEKFWQVSNQRCTPASAQSAFFLFVSRQKEFFFLNFFSPAGSHQLWCSLIFLHKLPQFFCHIA